jgi:hypothetical protein
MGAQTGSPETPRRLTASVQVNRGLTTTVTQEAPLGKINQAKISFCLNDVWLLRSR